MPAEPAYVPHMTTLMTAEDLLLPHVPKHAQLVRGVLVVREPPGFRHGEITARLTSALMMHVDARRSALTSLWRSCHRAIDPVKRSPRSSTGSRRGLDSCG